MFHFSDDDIVVEVPASSKDDGPSLENEMGETSANKKAPRKQYSREDNIVFLDVLKQFWPRFSEGKGVRDNEIWKLVGSFSYLIRYYK